MPHTPRAEANLLPARVRIASVHVGGLSPSAAASAVRAAFAEPLVLLAGERRITVSPSRLGAVAYAQGAVERARQADLGDAVELHVAVRGAQVRSYVNALARRLSSDPVDSRLTLRKLEPWLTEGTPGRRLDRLATVRAIVRALTANRRGPVRLPLREIPQAVSRHNFGPVIVIRRSSKQLSFYRGMKLEREFGVGVGQPAYPTPLGRFSIAVMWRNPWWYPPPSRWAQGLKPAPPGPGNPLGTRWMGLSAPAIGIHGTPDDASIGYSLSHGCIRMHVPEAEWLFQHVTVGTPVYILDA